MGCDVSRAIDMQARAVEFGRHNWQVGPLCHSEPILDDAGKPTGKSRILGPHGKNPCLLKRGVLDFTSDPATIARWWSRTPWNIGVRVPASMFVLDVDGPDRRPHPGRGLQALAELEDEHGPLPATLTQVTGSGGLHLFFRRPPGNLSKSGLPKGLEYKDNGGLVVVDPSVHPDSGQRYVWIDHPVATPPAWLVDLIVQRPRKLVANFHQCSPKFTGPSIADQYCAATSWADVLMPHGWACLSADPDADGARWLHPTATSSCSATIRHGCLFVYSSNTPFEITEGSKPHGYTKFRACAVLDHGGDLKAAARSMRGGVR